MSESASILAGPIISSSLNLISGLLNPKAEIAVVLAFLLLSHDAAELALTFVFLSRLVSRADPGQSVLSGSLVDPVPAPGGWVGAGTRSQAGRGLDSIP